MANYSLHSAATTELGGYFTELRLGGYSSTDEVSDMCHSASDDSDLDTKLRHNWS